MSESDINSVMTDAALAAAILKKLGTSKADQRALIKSTQINPKKIMRPGIQIKALDEWKVFANAKILLGEKWVWTHSDLWKPSSDCILYKAIKTAPTVPVALNTLVEYSSLLSPLTYFECFEADTYSAMSIETVRLSGENSGHQTAREIALLRVCALMQAVYNPQWSKIEISLCCHTPIFTDQLKKKWACRLKLETNRTKISIETKHLPRTLPLADTPAHSRAIIELQEKLNPNAPKTTVQTQVEHYLKAVTEGRPTSEDIARALNLSQRTLNRRLLDEGTSFRALLDTSLKRRAKTLLASKILSHGQISDYLGYNDQASFSRALRRWNIK